MKIMVDKIQVFQYNPTKWYFSNPLKVLEMPKSGDKKRLKKEEKEKRRRKPEGRRRPKEKVERKVLIANHVSLSF